MTVIVRPVNVATVTEALVQQLLEWPGLENVRVSRAAELNETPGNCPWLGVYRDSMEYVIKTLGYGDGFRDQQINLVVAAQAYDGTSGTRCEDRLEALLAEVGGAILSDIRLRGTVATVKELVVRYADYRKVGAGYMQTAGVYLTAIVPVSISQV